MSLDWEVCANGMSLTEQDESTASDAAPSFDTTGRGARDRGITLLYTKPLLDPVLREKADLANRNYAPHANELLVNPSMLRKYAAPSNLTDWRQMTAVLLGDLTDKELLDYGCGIGDESVYFAKLGARVTAIDISEVGISTLKKRAEYHKLDIRAFEMRCDPTSFPESSFDRIHGMDILHHVGVDTALAEVRRLLLPGGMGVFLDSIGDHLTWKEIEASTRRFSRMVVYPYHLLYRLKRFMPWSMYDVVRRFDHGLLSIAPGLRRYAGAVIIQVVK